MNETIIDNVVNYLTTAVRSGTEKVTDIINSNISQVWMANIILLIIATLSIFIASKITQKFAKIILYILGIILIVGIILNFFGI